MDTNSKTTRSTTVVALKPVQMQEDRKDLQMARTPADREEEGSHDMRPMLLRESNREVARPLFYEIPAGGGSRRHASRIRRSLRRSAHGLYGRGGSERTEAVVALVERSEAEHSGPLVMNTVDSTLAHYRPQTHVSSSFKIQGSEMMSPLLTRLGMEFQRRQPKVAIEVRGGGSGKAIAEFLQPPLNKVGKVMWPEDRAASFKMVASSREFFDNEANEFVAQHGYEPTVVPVAVDAVALYVHKDNPLAGLTIDQADAIFSTTRNRGDTTAITRWGQLGLDGEWEQTPIRLYGRDHKSGTRAFFQEHILAGGEFRPGLHENPGAASVILDVSRDVFGIGDSGLGLHASSVRVVPLAEAPGMPFITPSISTVADQTYPLRRVLYLYVDRSPQSPLPAAVQEFLSFIMSHEGQEAVVKAGFSPFPDRATKSPIALELSRAATMLR